MKPLSFGVLGPLTVFRGGVAVTIARPRERQLLSVLLANVGETVSSDRLIDALWVENLPAKPMAALQTAVSRMRSAIGDGDGSVVVTRAPGYVLEVDPAQIDAGRFESLVAEARDADAEDAATLLRDALGLWRGPAYAEVAYHEFARREIGRLEQLRVEALEQRIAADLELGAGQRLVGELEEAVAEFPHHERLWGHLMVALYRADRQADALDAFQRARAALVEELGLDPGPRLRRLEESILMHDPSLGSGSDVRDRVQVEVASLPRANVPARVTPLIGRERELQQVVSGLRESRLVTIVGPAGVGKTRLAIEAANNVAPDYADGIDFSAFDRYETEGTPQQRFLLDLGLRTDPGEATGRIIELTKGNEMLQILDGCETVIEQIPEAIRDVLAACPGLTILVTSRQRLGLPGEMVVPLKPLDLQGSAVELFAARAQALRSDVTLTIANRLAVDRIVEAVDGLPLGIELAAGRVAALPLEVIANDLETRVDLLATRDPTATPEHRSLQAAIAISWDPLPVHLQEALMGLAMFRGPWGVQAAAAVCGVSSEEALDSCVDLSERSMIAPTTLPRSEAGFVLLNSLRVFALRRLDESGHRDKALERYAEYHSRFVEESKDGVTGPDQGVWLQDIEIRVPDLRAVFAHLLAHDRPAALKFANNLTPFLLRSQRHRTGVEILREAIDANPNPTFQKAEALSAAGYLGRPRMGEYVENAAFMHPFHGLRETWATKADRVKMATEAIKTISDGIELYEQLDRQDQTPLARISLAAQLAELGEFGAARKQFEQAKIDGESAAEGGCSGSVFLANLALAEGDYELATDQAQQALDRACSQDDAWTMIEVLDVLARIAKAQGDWAVAFGHHREALEKFANPHGLQGAALLEAELGLVAARLEDDAAADRHTGRALRLARRHGLISLEGWIRYTQGMGRMVAGQHDNALRYVDQGYSIFETVGDLDRQAVGHMLTGMIEDDRGNSEAAASWYRRSLEVGYDAARDVTISLALMGMAAEHHRRGDDETAVAILASASAIQTRSRYVVPAYGPNRQLMPNLRDRLGDERWTAAQQRGATLTLSETIELALS